MDGLKYVSSHEWAKVEGGIATVGISDFAQSELGDIVFVELPDVGDAVKKGEQFGVVESVKVSEMGARGRARRARATRSIASPGARRREEL